MTEPDINADETAEESTSRTRRALLASVGAVGATTLLPTAAAQQNETSDEQDTDQGESEDEPTYLAQLSPTARVLDYAIRDVEDERATITVTVENDSPNMFALSDVFGGVTSEGVSEVQQQRQTLPSGRSKLSMDVSVYDDEWAAVGVAVSGGGAVTVSTGLPGKDGTQVGIPLAIAAGGGTGVAGVATGAWMKYRDDEDAPESAYEDDGGMLDL